MGNIADYFNLPVSSMSNTFTFLNAGILISIFLNAWLMEIVPLKTQLRFGFLLMVLAVAGLMFSHSLALFSAAMFILGVVSGITMSIGTFLVTQMYEGRQRRFPPVIYRLLLQYGWDDFPNDRRVSTGAQHWSGTGFMPASGWCMSLFLF
ncbi:major facilitator superfamily protein [Escherichia coli]|uniref:Major facilitator superfamily protein n=1 Tax=Escherichia coli TaxID=562 RepID=A0A376TRR0_ECOLX|nr:major facilitator superfamily protein [Escherichia coli]